MLKLSKIEDLRTKCDYCGGPSFTIIFELGEPVIICDKCGLPQGKKKDEPLGPVFGQITMSSVWLFPGSDKNVAWYTSGSGPL